jgi:magnesium transporter
MVEEVRPDQPLSAEGLREFWPVLSAEERWESFRRLPREEAADFFLGLTARGQAGLFAAMAARERRLWARLLAPDDAVDVIQEVASELREEILGLLDDRTRREVQALLAYREDAAGGLMSPRYARVRPEMTVAEAIEYLRKQARERLETIYYAYVVDPEQRLLGAVSLRELFLAPDLQPVREIMQSDVITVGEETDQEAVAKLIAQHDLVAVPVLDAGGRIKGIVTVDDIVDVVQEEATEDIQKLAGMEALEAPYLRTGFFTLLRKRAGWLAVLFVGEMLTASAMGYFEDEIASAVILALFVPLIISSGGNSGSQASTLVIRAMALGEVRLHDWWRVVKRELLSGLALGGILASLGLVRVLLWEALFHAYGDHAGLLALTVGVSLVGVVCWGTLTGALLPFALRALKFDPASASAPFVATVVDVAGLVIYFSVAGLLLHGTLL